MFTGQFTHNIDDKGRLVLPAKFRDQLTNGSIITIGYDGCLQIYTAGAWNLFMNNLLAKPMTNLAVRKTLRVLTGNASEIDVDKSGRINLPDYLIKAAGITKEVTLVGVGNVIEVWATEEWIKEQKSNLKDFEKESEKLYSLDKVDF